MGLSNYPFRELAGPLFQRGGCGPAVLGAISLVLAIIYHDHADETTEQTDSIDGYFYQGAGGHWITPSRMAPLPTVAEEKPLA